MTQVNSLDAQLQKERENEKRQDRERLIVAYLSRGNVLLQQGNFRAQQDINRLRDEVLSYNFDE